MQQIKWQPQHDQMWEHVQACLEMKQDLFSDLINVFFFSDSHNVSSLLCTVKHPYICHTQKHMCAAGILFLLSDILSLLQLPWLTCFATFRLRTTLAWSIRCTPSSSYKHKALFCRTVNLAFQLFIRAEITFRCFHRLPSPFTISIAWTVLREV